MIREPIVFFVADTHISKMCVTLPNGKQIVFDKQTSREYQTDDPEEIEFLTTKVKRLGSKKLNDKEYRLWTARVFKALPLVTKKITSIEEVEKYLWTTEFEKFVVSILRSKGYTVEVQKKQALDKKTEVKEVSPVTEGSNDKSNKSDDPKGKSVVKPKSKPKSKPKGKAKK